MPVGPMASSHGNARESLWDFAGQNCATQIRRGFACASDLPGCGTILTGGIIGLVLLMLGLAATKVSTAALLLNLESLATMGIACTFNTKLRRG